MPPDPLAVRGYRALLRLYPPRLRRAYGDEMVEVVRRRLAAARSGSRSALGLFVLRTWTEAVTQAVAAWVEDVVGGLRRRARSRRSLAAAGQGGGRRWPLGDLWWDLRLAARALARAPGFTVVVVLTLALGIGANTAVYSIVETVLLEPLPYPDPDRLLVVEDFPWAPTDIPAGLRDAGVDVQVAGFYPREVTLTDGAEPVQVEGVQVTPGFFELLGARMAAGRSFGEGDARPRAPRVAVIAHGLWQRRYGGAADVLGRTVVVDGVGREIVGVAERDFRQLTPGTVDPQLWTPVPLEANEPWGSFTTSSSTSRWTIPLVRLGPAADLEAAQAALDRVMARFREVNPELRDQPRWDLRLLPLKDTLVRDFTSALLVLQLSVLVVLVLACVNVANLVLVRAGSRPREMAVRAALGASRGHLLRYLLGEGLILSALGGGVALALATLGLEGLVALVPRDVPRIGDVSLDPSVLLLTFGVCLGTGVIFALVPALTSFRRDPVGALEGGGRTTTGSVAKHRLSQGLVVAEVTLTLILFVGAGLLARTFLSLTSQEPGFRTEDVVVVPLRVSGDRYAGVPLLEDFYRRVREQVAAIPGVEAVGLGNRLPIDRGGSIREFVTEDRSEAGPGLAQYAVVSPGYFSALGIPLLRGRDLEESDDDDSPRVAIVDEAMARAVWPGAEPVGKRLRHPDDDTWMTVVGVVGNTRGSGLDRAPEPGFYISYLQRPRTPVALATGRSAVLLVHSRTDPADLAAPLRRAVWDVDPGPPVPEIEILDRALQREVAPERLRAVLLATFAAVALLLVVAGIYGVVAYLVTERTRELGIRAAMGATGVEILGQVLRWGLRLTVVGVALGLLGVLCVTRYLAGFLFGVTPTDPATLALSVAAVTVVALAACAVPARRAMSVDPASALRSEGRGEGRR